DPLGDGRAARRRDDARTSLTQKRDDSQSEVELWSLSGSRRNTKIAVSGSVYSLAFSRDGTHLLVVGSAGLKVVSVEGQRNERLLTKLSQHERIVPSPLPGRFILSGTAGVEEINVSLGDDVAPRGAVETISTVLQTATEGPVHSTAVSVDGHWAAAAF